MRIDKLLSVKVIFGNYKRIFYDEDYRNVFILNFAISLLRGILIPVLPLWILHQIKLSISEVLFVIATSSLIGAILNFFFGYIIDFFKKPKIIFEALLILYILRSIVYSFFPYTYIVLLTNWLNEISLSSICFKIIKEDIVKKNQLNLEGQITSTIRASGSFAFILGPGIGLLMVHYLGYEKFYLFYSFLYLLLFLALKFKFLNIKITYSKKIKKIKINANDNIKMLPILLSAIIVILLVAGNRSTSTLLVFELHNNLSPYLIGLIFGIGPIFEAIAFPLLGFIEDKYNNYVALLFGGVIGIIYFYLFSLSINIYFLIFCQFIGAFYIASVFSSLMIYIQNIFGSKVGLSSSLYFSAISVSQVLSNLIMGKILSIYNVHIGFIVLALITLIGVAFFITVHKYYFRNLSSPQFH